MVWECDCGAIVAIGRVCSCGATYADQLAEKYGKAERKKREPKFRKPAEEREFTESYYFKKGKRK